MKKIKRTLKCILAMILTAAFIPELFATSITIIGGAEGAEYSAYLLLNAIDLGDGKYDYEINEKYALIIYEATKKSNDTDAIEAISKYDSSQIREFADLVYSKILDTSTSSDYHTTTNHFLDVAPGYYLIAETKSAGGSDIMSFVMLNTAGKEDITIETKEDIPTIIHKVKESDDVWYDAVDSRIGDRIEFLVTATLPKNIKSYMKNYVYKIHVTLSDGLTLIPGEIDDGYPKNIEVYLDNYNLIGTYKFITDTNGNGFIIETVNLNKVAVVNSNSVITVKYTAELNSKAITGGMGNSSNAYLEYSVSPYTEGTTTSTVDKVKVFTYALNLSIENKKGEPLTEAGYLLYKYKSDTYEQVGIEQKGSSILSFKGLDSGKYKLVQTTVPRGYNRTSDLIFIIEAEFDTESDDSRLNSLVVKDESGNILESFVTSPENGTISAKMISAAKGIELPTTGGIGTTVFYVVGGILMIGSIVMLAFIPMKDRDKKKNIDN